MPFKQMENISLYLEGCTKLGVPAFSSFQTVALYENKDMIAVINNIQALGSAAQKVPGYAGPVLGAKIADAAPRAFTEEQLRAGANTQTFLGKGSHGQANASGMVDRNKKINKMGHVSGVQGLGSADPTFLGTGSHGGATQAGMSQGRHDIARGAAAPLQKRVSGEFSSVAPVKRPSCTNVPAGSTIAGSAGTAVYSKFEDSADPNGNVKYGIDKDLADRAAAKYDTRLEGEVRTWIEAVTGDKLGGCSLQEELRNGIVLCNLVNVIKPGSTKPPSTSAMPFKQMENIAMYLEACKSLGVTDYDLFQTVALFENKDMLAVLTSIQSLGRVAQAIGFQGPALGAKLATPNARDFTEEQLAAGLYSQTFLGTGSHGQANASGMVDRNKEINKMGHVSGVEGLGSADPTFLGTGSHGCATQAGMSQGHHEIVRSQGLS